MDISQGCKDVATRQVNGENKFIAYCAEFAGLTEAQAVKVLNLYRKEKLLKIDPVCGQWDIKHGAFLEPDVMRRAAGIDC